MITREEHLKWCKERALEYVENNDLENAITSIMSDLRKHPETENHGGISLGMLQLMSGQLTTPSHVKKFINEFN